MTGCIACLPTVSRTFAHVYGLKHWRMLASWKYSVLQDFVSEWTQPARLGQTHIHGIFSESRQVKHRAAMRFKCQSLDLRSMVSVFTAFTEQDLVPLGACRAECAAALALASMCKLIDSTGTIAIEAAELLAAIHRYLECFVTVFGYGWLTPKAHWLLHLPECVQNIGIIVN